MSNKLSRSRADRVSAGAESSSSSFIPGASSEVFARKNKHVDDLAEILLRVKTKEQMENLLLGLFTTKELEELPNRVKIIKMLKKGIPQQEIAGKLKVGIATVTRGSREIKLGRFKYI